MSEIVIGTSLAENITKMAEALYDAELSARGTCYSSVWEAYSVMKEKVERAQDSTSEAPKLMKELWSDLYSGGDEGTQAVFMKDIERLAKDAASKWIRVAAAAEMAMKA